MTKIILRIKAMARRAIFLCLLLALSPAEADMMHSPTWGYAVDLPEGFTLAEKNGNDAYLFEHTEYPVSVVLRAYPTSRHSTPQKAMKETMSRLGADYDTADITWRGNPCVISQFSMSPGGSLQSGWGTAAPLKETDGIIVMLAYAPSEYGESFSHFIISCVDSLMVDRGSYYSAGPLTTFGFPSAGSVNRTLTISGTDITVQLDESDIEADEFVIEREYDVHCMYQRSPLWQEAWQRYYRQIFRNEYSRLEKAAFTIQNKLRRKLKDEKLIPQALLSWVQKMPYERQLSKSDFSPVTAILSGEGSDCDSRSMLTAILLKQMGYRTCIFVSAEYSHAILGVVLDKAGAKIKLGDNVFLVGETTAPVDIGLIAQDMSNPDKWLGVDFNFFIDE